MERIQQYIEIEQETKPTENGVPPAYWPASGNLDVQSLSARYSQDGPKVLHDISFQVRSGERVGIGMYLDTPGINDRAHTDFLVVGRTGSGKVFTLSSSYLIP